nr:ABC transporter G family member 11-like isoform X2 [Physcomitrium patens]|eukprot:XP_024384137.1 ABC transporter G family member 11-like isoform X2 [Physcomitrella patens]
MGPSGSGKSTLLDALAGRLPPNAVLTGNILLNGESKATLSYGTAAYVTQEDVLIKTLTVKETLMYSAKLRLPEKTREGKEKIVDSTIQDMGLSDCQHICVGRAFARGLSGGEKRRLSIALQILNRPQLLFLDEPTSGLDSAAAYFVVQTLKNLARDGRTVISSIHQPSSEVFAQFDNLTLLSGGRTIFFGQSTHASEFFAASGYPCPSMRNPSDHYLQIINSDFDTVKNKLVDIVQTDSEMGNGSLSNFNQCPSPSGAITLGCLCRDIVAKSLSTAYGESNYAAATLSRITHIIKHSHNGGVVEGSKGRASFLHQCVTLTQRSFVNMSRDPGYFWLRVTMYIIVGICLGTICWRVGTQYSSIFARLGCMFSVAAFWTFMSIGGFPSFVEDMKVFQHERLSGHYGGAAFVVANTFASIPYLCLISLTSGTLVYFLSELHPGFDHYAYFIIMLFACLACVESLMMMVSSVVGENFLAGIVVGAGIQAMFMLLAGFFRPLRDLPKPIWRYPFSYIAFHTYAIRGLFENDFLGLSFENFLVDGKPVGPNLSGKYILEQLWGIEISQQGRWGNLAVIFGMIAIYRLLFLVFIKLNENLRPRLRMLAEAATFRINKKR